MFENVLNRKEIHVLISERNTHLYQENSYDNNQVLNKKTYPKIMNYIYN